MSLFEALLARGEAALEQDGVEFVGVLDVSESSNGIFGALMALELVNDGPVTIALP